MSGLSLRRGRGPGLPALTAGAVAVFAFVLATACSESSAPTAPARAAAGQASSGPAAPSDLVTTTVGGSSLELWPFTGRDLPHDGQDATPSDPINLIFLGESNPLAIREALLELDGDRSSFGGLAAFDCTWSDAEGDVQTAYTTDAGWTGNVVELQCGSFGPAPRFHLRLFPAGDVTLGGAHFEIQIPGTTDHQVLSWELAEQLVKADLARAAAAGIVTFGAAPSQTGALNPVPWRAIDKDVYNLLLSDPTLGPVLPALTGGPSTPATSDVPLQTDGKATILTLAEAPAPVPGITTYDRTVEYEPLFPLPRPYCNPDGDRFFEAEGPVHLTGRIEILPNGRLVAQHSATGEITLWAVDPSTGTLGEAYKAEIRDQKTESYDGGTPDLTFTSQRQEVPPTGPARGSYRSRLHIGAGHSTTYTVSERCERP